MGVKFEYKIGESVDVYKGVIVKVFESKEEFVKFSGEVSDKFFEKDNAIYIKKDREYIAVYVKDYYESGLIVGKLIRNSNFDKFLVDVKNLDKKKLYEFTIGIGLTSYIFDKYKTEKNDKEVVFFIDEDKKDIVEKALVEIEGVYIARDLGNTPPNDLNPETYEKKIYEIFKNLPVKIKVLHEEDLRKEGLNLILAVGKGSDIKPRLVILEYEGSNDKPIVLVGKGVCFDAGGYNLKPSWPRDFIYGMHIDMAGSAAVVGAIYTIAKLGLKKHVVGLLPLVENLISGRAYKPGDIIKSYSGKTVEIRDTDAEGRLILADALAYAKKFNPKYIIDLATLTGAQIVALGTDIAALYGNYNKIKDEKKKEEAKKLVEKVREASKESKELVWEMPLHLEYMELLKSNFADIKNVSSGEAGSIQGALFLSEFVGEIPWVHLDIAGPAIPEKDKKFSPYGATGFGVRLLIKLVEKI